MAVEIFFRDLCPAAQRKVLNEFHVASEEEMNWDVVPLFMVELDPETAVERPLHLYLDVSKVRNEKKTLGWYETMEQAAERMKEEDRKLDEAENAMDSGAIKELPPDVIGFYEMIILSSTVTGKDYYWDDGDWKEID